MRSALEGVVIKWVSSITEALREDSNCLFLLGHPTPNDEIEFWNTRMKNLQNIYDQVCGDKVKSVIKILAKHDSVYFTAFKGVFKNLDLALNSAKDITLYINPLVNKILKCSTFT